MTDVLAPRDWALGIPLGWSYPSNNREMAITGNVLYDDRLFTLDQLSYMLWSDAVRGQVDFEQCDTADYLSPTLAIEKQNTGRTATPSQIADCAHRLIDIGLIWHFDPRNTDGYRQFEQFEIAVQGVPVGNVGRADQYRIYHNDGSPALDTDAVSYLLWLQWWTDPHVLGAAKYVGHQLAIADRRRSRLGGIHTYCWYARRSPLCFGRASRMRGDHNKIINTAPATWVEAAAVRARLPMTARSVSQN